MIHSGLDDIGQAKAIAGKVIQEVILWGLVEFVKVFLIFIIQDTHDLRSKPSKMLFCIRTKIRLLYY